MSDSEVLVEPLGIEEIKKVGVLEMAKAVNGLSSDEIKTIKDVNIGNGNDSSCESPQVNGDISDRISIICSSDSKEITLKSDKVEPKTNRPSNEIEKNGDIDRINNSYSNEINNETDLCTPLCDEGKESDCTTRSIPNSLANTEILESECNDNEIGDEALELVIDKTKIGPESEVASEKTESTDKEIKEKASEESEESDSIDNASSEKIVIKSEAQNTESTTDNGDPKRDNDESKGEEEISVIDKEKGEKLLEKSPIKRAKKSENKVDLPKRVTRSSSGISKAVKYLDSGSLSNDDDDDEIKITKEVKKKGEEAKKKDEESDIEMIEECDPLAISDADVKKAKEAVKDHVGTNSARPPVRVKQNKTFGVPKKDSNVIIIDTNTLLKQQGTIAAAAHTTSKTVKVPSVSASAQTTAAATTITPATQIQNAIHAITGGNPAIQGLQSAYLSAIQQVLIAQGGGQVSNPHYLAQLQQYYNTLGALQDDAYVIEAPSFIVPYVMEGKPVESIKEFLEKTNKEFKENEKKKLEEVKEKKDKEEREKKDKIDEDCKKKLEDENQKSSTEAKDPKEKSEFESEKSCSDTEEKMDTSTEDKDKIISKESEENSLKYKMDTNIDDKADGNSGEKEEKLETMTKLATSEEDVALVPEKEKTESDKQDEDKESVSNQEVTAENKDKDLEKSVCKETEGKEDSPVADNEGKGVLEKKEIEEEKKSKEVDKSDSEKQEKDNKMSNSSEDDNKENKVNVEQKSNKNEEVVIDLDKEEDVVKKDNFKHLGRWESYYKSALGKFFLDLGLNHAQEFIQSDLLKMQKRKLEKMKTNPSKQDIIGVKVLESQLVTTKRKNEHLSIQLKTCKYCSFKTESQLVMERHLESPHMINYTYKCNFCDFETRGPQVILFHTEAEHNVRGRLERAPAFFQCPICPYEDNNKSKMTRHALSCIKKFKPDKNCDLSDWEPPAKIPKIQRGRPNTFNKTFESLKMPNTGMLPKNLSGLGLNIQTALSSGMIQAGSPSHVNSLVGRGRGRPVGSYKTISQTIGGRTTNATMMYQNRAAAGLLQPIPGVTSAQQLSLANQVLQSVTGGNRVPRILPASSTNSIIPGLAASSSITIQSVQNKTGGSKSPQQPSISITPLPRGGTQPSTTKSNSSTSSARPAFVICEICDGYIKDLEQLRNHMNLIHKVKIHPKMIYNRPPLNCQKCQHRFFTDQGLERHLLGTHGLVTSSMQEAANKGKDAGRCPICGKVFQWKLLNHVSRDHKMTLKPAHLSYKCTVCTATFNMYRLFENHVYSAHSVVNKNKNNDTSVNNSSNVKKPADAAPMKINDEITIIPQPASKNSKGDGKTSPKKSDSPTVSKEITITKVGSTSRRRSGGGVEVISLDDSPQKRQLEENPKKKSRETSTSKRARTSS